MGIHRVLEDMKEHKLNSGIPNEEKISLNGEDELLLEFKGKEAAAVGNAWCCSCICVVSPRNPPEFSFENSLLMILVRIAANDNDSPGAQVDRRLQHARFCVLLAPLPHGVLLWLLCIFVSLLLSVRGCRRGAHGLGTGSPYSRLSNYTQCFV